MPVWFREWQSIRFEEKNISNKYQDLSPCVSVLVPDFLLHLGISKCLKKGWPLFCFTLGPEWHLHTRKRWFTASKSKSIVNTFILTWYSLKIYTTKPYLYVSYAGTWKYQCISTDKFWVGLTLYGMYGKLFDAVKSFYDRNSVCVRIHRGMSEPFEINMGVNQSVMSLWLFTVFMDDMK